MATKKKRSCGCNLGAAPAGTFKLNETDRANISWVVGKLHVSASDKEVRDEIRGRLEKFNKQALPEDALKKVLAYAVRVHHTNQRIYRKVMGGNLGSCSCGRK